MKTISEIRLECLRMVAAWVTAKVIYPKDAITHAAELFKWTMDTTPVSGRGVSARDELDR